MPTLLQIDSSPLDSSISRELTREFVTHWQAAHPQGRVIRRDLTLQTPPLVNAAWVAAAYTPAANRTRQQQAVLATSDALIAELEQADTYVIGVPMHNFSIPAVLKLWIDQIAVPGRTFSFGPSGPMGLLQGKHAVLMVASGGDYTSGSPMAALNFVEPYLRALLGFLGISDVEVIPVAGVSRLNTGAIDRPTLLEPALLQTRAAVSNTPVGQNEVTA